MRLTLEGDINSYYAQTLCLIFFPGAKFPKKEEADENGETTHVIMRLTRAENGYRGFVSIDHQGRHVEYESLEKFRSDGRFSEERIKKNAVGQAMVHCGCELFGVTPPWGFLTGIRPGKLAKELYRLGKSPTEIKRTMTRDYLLNPKKSSLVTDIALNELKITDQVEAEKDTCSVYISIPFCPSRCVYCSFVSYSTKRLLDLIPAYLDQLCRDIENTFAQIHALGQRILTIYIGGGTPTILSPAQLDQLLSCIRRCLNPSDPVREFTLEGGRPDTITPEKMAVIASYGVGRVCVNTQSLNDTVLQAIGRHHTAEDYYRAFDIVRNSGIHFINTDLIAGLPYESYTSFARGVDEVLKLRPENITVHTFCVKKSAEVLKTDLDIYSITGGDTGKSVDYSQVKARNAGYLPYYIYRQKNTIGNLENVGFALPGFECFYNILIMEEIHSIYAIGAGATTKIVSPDNGQIMRLYMPKYPYEYLNAENRDGVVDQHFETIRAFLDENRT